MRANEFTAFAEEPQQKADFLIDYFRSRLFAESLFLISEDHSFVRIDDHGCAQKPGQMAI
jgi:hypothetical protein